MTDSEKSEDQEPKIIVDDDWKEQVAKEKEAADSEAQKETVSDIDPATIAEERDSSAQQPPPASFDVLVTMLFTQAMSTLGQFPNPATGETEINKPFAKHFIDTMEMLEEKTKGNLTDDEKNTLSETLHALRMAYVNTKA